MAVLRFTSTVSGSNNVGEEEFTAFGEDEKSTNTIETTIPTFRAASVILLAAEATGQGQILSTVPYQTLSSTPAPVAAGNSGTASQSASLISSSSRLPLQSKILSTVSNGTLSTISTSATAGDVRTTSQPASQVTRPASRPTPGNLRSTAAFETLPGPPASAAPAPDSTATSVLTSPANQTQLLTSAQGAILSTSSRAAISTNPAAKIKIPFGGDSSNATSLNAIGTGVPTGLFTTTMTTVTVPIAPQRIVTLSVTSTVTRSALSTSSPSPLSSQLALSTQLVPQIPSSSFQPPAAFVSASSQPVLPSSQVPLTSTLIPLITPLPSTPSAVSVSLATPSASAVAQVATIPSLPPILEAVQASPTQTNSAPATFTSSPTSGGKIAEEVGIAFAGVIVIAVLGYLAYLYNAHTRRQAAKAAAEAEKAASEKASAAAAAAANVNGGNGGASGRGSVGSMARLVGNDGSGMGMQTMMGGNMVPGEPIRVYRDPENPPQQEQQQQYQIPNYLPVDLQAGSYPDQRDIDGQYGRIGTRDWNENILGLYAPMEAGGQRQTGYGTIERDANGDISDGRRPDTPQRWV